MKKLKVELLKIGKERGDTGDTSLQQEWIENFLAAVQQYLTPDAILSFTPADMRVLYLLWLEEYTLTRSFQAASDLIVRHIEIAMEPRV